MPNNCLSVLYKHIIQVENKNVGLKVWEGRHKHTIAPPPPSFASAEEDWYSQGIQTGCLIQPAPSARGPPHLKLSDKSKPAQDRIQWNLYSCVGIRCSRKVSISCSIGGTRHKHNPHSQNSKVQYFHQKD